MSKYLTNSNLTVLCFKADVCGYGKIKASRHEDDLGNLTNQKEVILHHHVRLESEQTCVFFFSMSCK